MPSSCPNKPGGRHNWIGYPIRGWLPWRLYRVCCSCGHEERWEKNEVTNAE